MIKEAEINHSRTFIFECSLLLDYKNMYSSLVDSLFNDYLYFLDVDSTTLLSEKTLKLYKIFFNLFKDYLGNHNYGRDQVFVYLDPAWMELRKDYLLPFIKSAEEDFINNKIKYTSILDSTDIYNRPGILEILKRGAILYKLVNEKTE